MPELFPTETAEIANEAQAASEPIHQGDSWQFDWNRLDFVLSPTGKVMVATDLESYVGWCYKALQTPRYRYPIYSRNYGQEFENLIRRSLTREANESELERMIRECLMVNPITASVEGFTFEWTSHDEVIVSFTVVTVLGEAAMLTVPVGGMS